MSLDRYQQFKQRLERLDSDLDMAVPSIVQQIAQLQQWFQVQILKDSIESSNSLAQSYITEMHKQLRLLATDAAFLQAARQETTRRQRRQEIHDRLSRVCRYCDALSDNSGR
ncbi:MAG: heterocyst frequency control protein PatD [Cyanobacteria bacterium SID2]|nr:heterocyst frequency control protein PatD [Cyanobacteria bacterium SID2]MBP0006830.1 heterocyst frequency control protein PatD [Cyanobacteria bacterium SBC]